MNFKHKSKITTLKCIINSYKASNNQYTAIYVTSINTGIKYTYHVYPKKFKDLLLTGTIINTPVKLKIRDFDTLKKVIYIQTFEEGPIKVEYVKPLFSTNIQYIPNCKTSLF